MDVPPGPPWFFWLFVAFVCSVAFGIFLMTIIRACQYCCRDKPKPRVNQTRRGRYVTNRTSDMESGFSPGFDAPPAYDDVMFTSDSWGGGHAGGCDTGGGDNGGGCDSGGGGSCDSGGGGGCDSGGGGGCDSGGGGGCDSGGGGGGVD